jgi:hypothetical protein
MARAPKRKIVGMFFFFLMFLYEKRTKIMPKKLNRFATIALNFKK